MTDPLTPAQVEVLEQWLADRQAHLLTTIDGLIAESVAPLHVQIDALTQQVATLQEALAILDHAALKVGTPIALRAANGKLLCAEDGGPSEDGMRFVLVARTTVGAWESFATERGQG